MLVPFSSGTLVFLNCCPTSTGKQAQSSLPLAKDNTLTHLHRGIGLGWTEFCINIPWGALSVYLATLLLIHATWRWCFYITIIYSVVCIVGTAVFYFPPSHPRHDYEKTRMQQLAELDFVGLLLLTAGLTTFLVGMTTLGKSSYDVAMVASTITIGALVFIGAFIYDFTIPKNPIFPLHLFKMFREFTVHLIILFIAAMVWQGVVTLGPQGTLYMFTNDPIQIGIIMIPSTMSGVLGGWILPSLVHKIKHVRLQIVFALLCMTAFSGSYAAVVPNNRMAWSAMQLFGQSCFTWVTTLAYVSSGLFVPQEQLGVSAGLLGSFRSAGGSVGNAIFSTIMTSISNRDLATNIAAAAFASGHEPGLVLDPRGLAALVPAVVENAVGAPDAFDAVPGGVSPAVVAATGLALRETYAHAFRMVFYAMIPLGVVATCMAWFVRDPSHLLNNHVAVRQEREVLDKAVHADHVRDKEIST